MSAVLTSTAWAEEASDLAAAAPRTTAAVPWSDIGGKARANYRDDGRSVAATTRGTRLRCAFQRLDAEATSEGLWLTSTVTNMANERFRVTATRVGREKLTQPSRLSNGPSSARSTSCGGALPQAGVEDAGAASEGLLPSAGTVQLADNLARFVRPGLIEEYSASMDGVRQDFVVMQRPAGAGELQVRLGVTGARVEVASWGACLVLSSSGRKIAYSRVRAIDATGRELAARVGIVDGKSLWLAADDSSHGTPVAIYRSLSSGAEVAPIQPGDAPLLFTSQDPTSTLALRVKDLDAVYPLRIDPTFSDANWISMNPTIPGAGSWVFAAVADGSGNLYIGGEFSAAGDVVANHVAKWNGSSWSALGSGVNDNVYALAVSGTNLYAGGAFTTAGGNTANYIAKWNGSSWSALGSGMNVGVVALTVSGTDLYAGGGFTTAGGSPAAYVAKWNGSSWSALSALGLGMNGSVYALAVSGSSVYAGGWFTSADGNWASYIAKWNGSSWTGLGGGMGGPNPFVYALAVSGSDLYAGGGFTTAGGSPAAYVAKWNGGSWTALASGMSGTPVALTVSGGDLYAGGGFTTAGGAAADFIAKWNGTSWSALVGGIGGGLGFNADVDALAVAGSNVYAGGTFTTARGIAANRVAKWNGSGWAPLGSGMNSNVNALAVSGSNVYAGGFFTTAGGIAANQIAKWDGSTWTALGSGMNNYVVALAVSGSDLYAGGAFTAAGGNTANYIAKWNGSSWTGLGSWVSSRVLALAVSGADIYAGGGFGVAKWNGSGWSALGWLNDSVYALAVSGNSVYAGGLFTTAGGNTANYIAKWDGSNWTALGSGMATNIPYEVPCVYALAVSGSNLYAGGAFTTAGGNAANFIAKWNGTSWSALASGMNGGVGALTVSGTDLYAGGGFTTAGGKVSAYIARAYLPNLPALSVFRSSADVTVSWPSANTAGFALEQKGTLATSASWLPNNATVADDGTNNSVTIPSTNSPHFFRLRRP